MLATSKARARESKSGRAPRLHYLGMVRPQHSCIRRVEIMIISHCFENIILLH